MIVCCVDEWNVIFVLEEFVKSVEYVLSLGGDFMDVYFGNFGVGNLFEVEVEVKVLIEVFY